MQQIFSIFSLIPGYLVFLAIVLVILPTIVAIALRFLSVSTFKKFSRKNKKIFRRSQARIYSQNDCQVRTKISR